MYPIKYYHSLNLMFAQLCALKREECVLKLTSTFLLFSY